MKKTLTFSILFVLGTFIAGSASAGESHIEILAGGHYTSAIGISSGSTVGVRGGYRFTDRWTLEGTLSRVDEVDVDFFPFLHVGVDSTQVDVSAKWTFRPDRKVQVYFYTGPGMSFYDVSVNGHNVASIDDSFAWHVGTGLQVALGERAYLRPDFRFRSESEPRSHDEAVELTLGFGWRFGGAGQR